MEAWQAQQNNDEEERRREEQRRQEEAQRQQEAQREAGPIPVLQKPDTMIKMNAYGAEGSKGIKHAPERPVTGPQGQRMVYEDEFGDEELSPGVYRVGEGLIPAEEKEAYGVTPYGLQHYSAGHNTPTFQDWVYRHAIAEEAQKRLESLREVLPEKEADVRAGQVKESYGDYGWDPIDDDMSRAYEAKLMREIWAMEPKSRPYPAQYEYEHYHGNGVRDPYTGRVK